VTTERSKHRQAAEITGLEAGMAIQRNHFNCRGGGADAGFVTLTLTYMKQRSDDLDFDTLESHNVVESAPEGA
jgi:hypothetical protein